MTCDTFQDKSWTSPFFAFRRLGVARRKSKVNAGNNRWKLKRYRKSRTRQEFGSLCLRNCFPLPVDFRDGNWNGTRSRLSPVLHWFLPKGENNTEVINYWHFLLHRLWLSWQQYCNLLHFFVKGGKTMKQIKRDENGIVTMGVLDFLLDENSLAYGD